MYGNLSRFRFFITFLCACSLVVAGTQLSVSSDPGRPSVPLHTIYLVRHAWHAGLVLQTAELDTFPVLRDFPDAEYLEIGWGDADYYRNPHPGFWITFKAALLPTQSTLHVVGFSEPVTTAFPGTDIIRLDIDSPQKFQSMVDFIRRAFALDNQGHPMQLGPGLYGHSYFYQGRAHYYAFKNCNTWTAHALNQAGIPLSPVTNLTVGWLIDHVKQYGKVVERRTTEIQQH